MNSWGTPAIKSAQLETCSFKTTFCFLSFKKSAKSSSRFRLIPFCLNLKMIPSCWILSNAFDISRKTPLTAYPSSNDFQISWVIDNIWLIQESTVLKPDLFVATSLFLLKKFLPKKFSSRIFPQMGVSNTGRQYFKHCLSPFL